MTGDQPTKACPWCAETILVAAKKCKHCGEFLDDDEHAEMGAPAVDPSAAPQEAASEPQLQATCIACGTAQVVGMEDVEVPFNPPPSGMAERWLPDPAGRFPDRWWNGFEWTKWVRDRPDGTRSEDPPCETTRQFRSFECRGCHRIFAIVNCPSCKSLNQVDPAARLWNCINCGRSYITSRNLKKEVMAGRKQPAPPPRPMPTYTGQIGSREKLSTAGLRSQDGILMCPKCGGTQFTAKRSNKGKVVGIGTLGVAGLIAPKSQVKCVTCGTMFKRG